MEYHRYPRSCRRMILDASGPRRRILALAGVFFALGLVGCDHATKSVAETALAHRPALSLVSGVVDLRYAENHDTAFSLLSSSNLPHKALLILALSFSALMGVAIVWFRRRAQASAAEHAAFAMILAGAVGNVADRARRGFVVDFIHVEHWPVFNVADVAVVAGVLLLGLIAWKRRRGTATLG
jgi:signal peptidase II